MRNQEPIDGLRQQVLPSEEKGQYSWSAAEVEATVSDYFSMFRSELTGEPLNKTAHRKALLKRLNERTAPAVEFKHCNISAVLRDKGLSYISGYKPRGNYLSSAGMR